jgi:DNA-binding transcriptional LysR family regulator
MSAMSNITLRQIEAFLAVARELKFAAAAERLHVSAPYLSQTIKQLEHALGYTLLTRTTRSVELTPAGGVFTGLAERALADLERAIQAAGTIARPPRANLRLGYTIGAGLPASRADHRGPPVARPVARLLDPHRVPLHPGTRRSRGGNLRNRTAPRRKRTRDQRHGDGRRTLLQPARCRFRPYPRPRTLPRRARLVARRHRLRRRPRHRRHPHLQHPARPGLSFDTGIMKGPGAHYAVSDPR